MGAQRESTERKDLLIKTMIIILLFLLAIVSTILYVFAYPRTKVTFIDMNTHQEIYSVYIRRHSALGALEDRQKVGHSFLGWTYYNGEPYDPSRTISEEEIQIYANYERNEYTINFNVQVYDDEYNFDTYLTNQKGYEAITGLYDEEVTLWWGTKGNVEDGELLDELKARPGYHFVGWTTKVEDEDEKIDSTDIYKVGAVTHIPPVNTNFYAIF